MRRIMLWAASTAVVLVLLFGYRTSTMGPGGPAGPAEAAVFPGPPEASGGPGNTAPPGPGTVKTYDGSVVQTRFGPVQVRVTIGAGRITDVSALQVPDSSRKDRDINGRAVPVLRRETLKKQSAAIDTVSGATYTSDGYRRSLQAALDTAAF